MQSTPARNWYSCRSGAVTSKAAQGSRTISTTTTARSSPEGRRGGLRTFWNLSSEGEVVVSSMEVYFDFDTPKGGEPDPPDDLQSRSGVVSDESQKDDDVLGRCFRFRYERSLAKY